MYTASFHGSYSFFPYFGSKHTSRLWVFIKTYCFNKVVLMNTHKLCFWAKWRKIIYTPINITILYLKWDFHRCSLHGFVNVMWIHCDNSLSVGTMTFSYISRIYWNAITDILWVFAEFYTNSEKFWRYSWSPISENLHNNCKVCNNAWLMGIFSEQKCQVWQNLVSCQQEWPWKHVFFIHVACL